MPYSCSACSNARSFRTRKVPVRVDDYAIGRGNGVRISPRVFTPSECRTQIAACPLQGPLTLLSVVGRSYSERWQALFERDQVATKYHDQDDRRARALLIASNFNLSTA